jgi:hypothetical protein
MKKLSNTFKHFRIGTLIGAIMSMPIAFLGLFDAAIFSCIVFLLFTIGWERNQNGNLLDSIVDVIVGNIGFNFTFWLVMYFSGYFK